MMPSKKTNRHASRAAYLLIIIPSIFLNNYASGQCEPDPYRPDQITFRVNTSSFELINGIGGAGGSNASVIAGDIWNHQGNGPHFRYLGSTLDENLPPEEPDCQNIDYDLLIVVSNEIPPIGTAADFFGACREMDFPNHNTKWVIRIFRYTAPQILRPWTSGDPVSSNDLPQVLVHEFGHAVGLDDYPQNASVMMYGWGVDKDGRNLFHYDIDCTIQVHRNVKIRHRSLLPYNPVGDEITINRDVFHADISHYDFNGQSGYVFEDFDALAWNGDLTTGNPIYFDRMVGAGPASAYWRNTYGIIFSRIYDDIDTQFGKRIIQAYKKNLNWQVNHLKICTQMNQWMHCSNEEAKSNIYSTNRVANAYDNYNDEPVFVWLEQTRIPSTNNRIMIATGTVDDFTLPTPYNTMIRSTVTPGVACNAFHANQADCVLAYVPIEDKYNRVKVITFFSMANGNNYTTYLGPEFYLGEAVARRTASRITAWVQNDYFWVAIRSSYPGQNLYLYHSLNGYSWTYYGATFPSSIEGPSTISYQNDGNNIMLYTRQ